MSEDSPAMTSHRPYLLRALNEWIADNGMTPHLLVDATRPGVQVPAQAVNDAEEVRPAVRPRRHEVDKSGAVPRCGLELGLEDERAVAVSARDAHGGLALGW